MKKQLLLSEFYDVNFSEVKNVTIMSDYLEMYSSLFLKKNSEYVLDINEDFDRIRFDTYLSAKRFLLIINESKELNVFLSNYDSGFLLCTTIEPDLDYFNCLNREIDFKLMQTLISLKLTFAYTVQF